MKYRLIAMDMDGTLLNSRGEISPKTLDCLNRAADAGCYITLSTGRSYPAVLPYLKLLPVNAPLILYNGAMVASPSGEILFHQSLNEAEASAILHSPYAPENVVLWKNNQLFYLKETPETARYEASAKSIGQVFDFKDLSGITKCLWIDEPDLLNKRKSSLKGTLPDTISYYNSKSNYLEFVSGSVSKGSALVYLCRHLNIAPEESIAFGDGENDLPLLKAAGLSVVMENATSSVYPYADFITASNDNDGIALALERFL